MNTGHIKCIFSQFTKIMNNVIYQRSAIKKIVLAKEVECVSTNFKGE